MLGALIQPVAQSFLPISSGDVLGPPSAVPGRKGVNAFLSYEFNAFTSEQTGETVVNFNCLSCHAQKLNGQVVVGLGNAMRDFTVGMDTLVDASRLLVRTDREETDWTRWARSIRTIAPYIQTRTGGVNPAVNLTYALFAFRDPETLALGDRPLIEPPSRDPLPVDVPPWWRTSKRKTAFYNGEFPAPRHRTMMLASALCTDSPKKVEALVPRFMDVEAYLNTIKAPPYPARVDRSLAARGEGVYKGACARCHGTYGPGGAYKEVFVPVADVGTDPELADLQMLEGPNGRFADWFERSPYGRGSPRPGARRGYLAPPLDGIWPTAPYLHNGSVPTLEGVLDSRERPRLWRRDPEGRYDTSRMSWTFDELSSVGFFTSGQRWIYDTTARGYGNGGHRYGDRLEDADRRAVLEYLKTL